MDLIVVLVVVSLICVASVVVLCVLVFTFPFLIIAAYFLWIIGSFLLLVLPEKAKGIEQFFLTIIFLVILLFNIPYEPDARLIFGVIITTFCNLPVFYFLSEKIQSHIYEKKEKENQIRMKKINRKIEEHKHELGKLESEFKNRNYVIRLIDLLEICGEDVEVIKNDPNIKTVNSLLIDIQKQTDEITRLKDLLPK